MPIPTPHADESQREFMSRCMSDEVMQNEYPEDDQRAAICHGQWRERERDAEMNMNQKLIDQIQSRSGQQFGYGITTADRYVLPALDSIGRGAAAKYFKCLGDGREQLAKRSAGTLVFCGEDTETIEKRTGSASDIEAIIGAKAPMHSMMAIVNRLTTPSEDRDGDTLQTAGAMMDAKAPLLWQHIHTLPIGKMVRIIEQSKDLLKVATVLLDINELTSDAAKLVEAGVLRFSHGFIPLEFEERKGGPYARFNVLKFEIVEESLVSVPSNRDAEIELFSRGKLTSEPFKNHARALFDARNPIVAGADSLVIEKGMLKYNPDQPRDENGRWGGGGSSGSSNDDGSTSWEETSSGGTGGFAWTEERSSNGDFNYSATDKTGYIGPDGVQKAFSNAAKGRLVRLRKTGDDTDGIGGRVVSRSINKETGKFTSLDVDVTEGGSGTKRFSAGGTYAQIFVSPSKKSGDDVVEASARLIRTKRLMRKMFDVATERLEPCTQEQDWAARFIGCNVKDMSVHTTCASGMMIGAFLAGLDAVTGKYHIAETRNLGTDDGRMYAGTADGKEKPPVHKTIEITSDQTRNFLVEGIRFAKADDHRIVWRLWEGWGAQHLLIYTDNEKHAHAIIEKVWEWMHHNNPLNGQAFAAAGGWISKTGTAWEDVFLEEPVEKSLKRTVKVINSKGAEAANRGLVLAGPPGTGKTLSARVILNEANATFIWVSAKDFWKLGPYEAFAGTFSLARELAPSIICFEDVDNWIDSYTVDLLKGEMDGLQQSSGVTTILTTNFPDQLPAALIDRPGRFHDVLEIHLPTREVRLRMLSKWAADAGLDALAKMADETDGYSGAHVYELCRFAKTLRDEDECTLDEALTKAFTKIKEQREQINQSQLSGASYRPGRRELADAVSKGWTGIADGQPRDGFTRMVTCGVWRDNPSIRDGGLDNFEKSGTKRLLHVDDLRKLAKEMGECKGCGEKRNLNDDGYCAKCAKEESEDHGFNAPPMPRGYNPDQPRDENGRWGSGGSGSDSGSGGSSNSEHSYGGDTGTSTVKVDKIGQIKLTKPKSSDDSVAQLKALNKIMEAAQRDVDNGVQKASLRLHHATQQLSRAMGFGNKLLGKSTEVQLKTLIEKLKSKWGVDPDTNPSDDDPRLDLDKTLHPLTKAGRVLSQRNYDALVDVTEDLGECEQMEMGRPAKALIRGCRTKLQAVLDAAAPAAEPEAAPAATAKIEEPKSIDHVLAISQAIESVTGNRALRDRLRRSLDSLDKSDEMAELADMYRVVTRTG